MKFLTKKELIPVILIIICFVVGFYFYPQLPDRVPSHWNVQGEVDDWSSKTFAVWFFPLITLFIYLLMTFIPLIDPLRKNYSKFAFPYFWFRTIFVIFFIGLYFYTLWAGLGTNININYFIIPAISLLFIFMGVFLPKIKKNYFVGIRTPWTIHSEEVWDKTHLLAGKLYILTGIIFLLGLLFSDYLMTIILVTIFSTALIPVIYSYIIFKRIGGFKND
jgi:uncharacterized membrane protein